MFGDDKKYFTINYQAIYVHFENVILIIVLNGETPIFPLKESLDVSVLRERSTTSFL